MKTNLQALIVTFFISCAVFSQTKSQEVALNWIKNNKELKIQPGHDLEMLFKREGRSGKTFRYYQMINGIQVFDASIAVHLNKRDEVTYHSSTYDSSVAIINTSPSISESDALQKSISDQKIKEDEITHIDENKLYVYNKLDEAKLVYRLVIASKSKPGLWETIVDAKTGDVLSTKDIALYYNNDKDKEKATEKKKKKDASLKNPETKRVNGTGFVFDTDPLTATGNEYGGDYSDNNDENSDEFEAARSAVTLLDIEFSGGEYNLSGPYARISELQNPEKGLFSQSSDDFSFNREEDGFEAVNAYYHIDKSMRYINEVLNIDLESSSNNGVVLYDPHGASGADNSTYGGGRLNFGEGCVDDGEDADVILHELGHGLHDWITNGGLSNTEGLSEGSGDYWAMSYKRSLDKWDSSDDSYHYVFGWDGHNDCWNGRVTNYDESYPDGLSGSIHASGQIWATTLMEIWDVVGREKTDTAFLEGLAMTGSGANQEDAAIAVRQAAIDMEYSCEDITVFTEKFEDRGYDLPNYTCTLSVDDVAIASISIFPNPTRGEISFKNIKEAYDVEIYNMLGQSVQKGAINTSKNTINVSNLSEGTYFLKFKSIDKVLKFVKM